MTKTTTVARQAHPLDTAHNQAHNPDTAVAKTAPAYQAFTSVGAKLPNIQSPS
jgi:hypothetical protein